MSARVATLLCVLAAATPVTGAEPAVLQVRTVIAPRVIAELESAPRVLVVDRLDLERGYVDVASPLVVRLRSNLAHAFALEFRSSHDAVARVEVRAASMPLVGAATAGLLVPAIAREQSLVVYVRLFLGPQAAAGTYPWPVRVGGAA